MDLKFIYITFNVADPVELMMAAQLQGFYVEGLFYEVP